MRDFRSAVWAATLLLCGVAQAQTVVPARVGVPPAIDGKLDDAAWGQATAYREFVTYEPVAGQPAAEQTAAYAAYDAQNLYFAFRCSDFQAGRMTASLTRRDNIVFEDKVGVLLDLYHDQQSAVRFMANPLGVQEDAMMDETFSADLSKDFVWYSAGAVDGEGYCVEMQIPIKGLRFQAGEEVTMGIGFWRHLIRLSEWSSFPAVVRDKGIVLSQLGTVVYRGLRYRRALEVLPSVTHAYADERGATSHDTNLGVTAVAGLASAVTVEATLYPDFNQVEADASQVAFNVRSAVIYEEKRQFFLEGTEHFLVAGTGNYNNSHVPVAVHTRKIVDPLAGVKLTARPGCHVIALLAAADESPKALEGRSENAAFGIARYKKLLGEDSYVGALFTARELAGGYNRAAGADGRYRFSGTTSMQFDCLHARSRDSDGGPAVHGSSADLVLRFRNERYQGDMSVNATDADFDLATGFVNRNGIRSFSAGMERAFFPGIGPIATFKPAYWVRLSKDTVYGMRESAHQFFLTLDMSRSSHFHINFQHKSEVFAGTLFDTAAWETFFETRPWKVFYAAFYGQLGGKPYYDPAAPYQGDERVFETRVTFQPNPRFSLEGQSTWVRFSARATGEVVYNIHIHRARLTYQANRSLFFRAIGEYDDSERHFTTDFLASFTYIPGTVCHVGYGALYEKDAGVAANTRRTYEAVQKRLFVKAAYNWRL